MILDSEPSTHPIHHIVLLLGGFHAAASFLGPIRGLPFNIQGGGGRDIGMDKNICFNMIQLMVIFFHLLFHRLENSLVR